jgi:hypothetical protein
LMVSVSSTRGNGIEEETKRVWTSASHNSELKRLLIGKFCQTFLGDCVSIVVYGCAFHPSRDIVPNLRERPVEINGITDSRHNHRLESVEGEGEWRTCGDETEIRTETPGAHTCACIGLYIAEQAVAISRAKSSDPRRLSCGKAWQRSKRRCPEDHLHKSAQRSSCPGSLGGTLWYV